MKDQTMRTVLTSKKLDVETHARYNYCPYGFRGICVKDEQSQCLLSKCYHDMNPTERGQFVAFWCKSKQFFNKCNHYGNADESR